jgi:hypothetical protein
MDVAGFSKDGAKRVKTNRWRKETNGSGKIHVRCIVRAKRLMDGAKKPMDGERDLWMELGDQGFIAKRQMDGAEKPIVGAKRSINGAKETNGSSTETNGATNGERKQTKRLMGGRSKTMGNLIQSIYGIQPYG